MKKVLLIFTILIIGTYATSQCDMCEKIVNDINTYIESNKSINYILNDTIKYCKVYGPFDNFCQYIIGQDINYIYHFLMNNFTPKEVCENIGFCQIKKIDIKYDICVEFTKYAINMLNKTDTHDFIIKTIYNECNKLNYNKEKCVELFDDVFNSIIEYSINNITPSNICCDYKEYKNVII